MLEKTLVILKPDAVKRNLIGEIISIFEKANLKIEAMKMLTPEAEKIEKHYPNSEKWLTIVGEKTMEGYEALGLNVEKELGTNDKKEIGLMVKKWLVEFMTSGKVVAMVISGNSAISKIRKLCGNTMPINADTGSIRGKYSSDSPDLANKEKRPVKNLIHASGEPDEAEFEINLWFPELT